MCGVLLNFFLFILLSSSFSIILLLVSINKHFSDGLNFINWYKYPFTLNNPLIV